MTTCKNHFGELEQAIMDVVWRSDRITVREVVDKLKHRPVAYTTVMTVMNRLTKQRILLRRSNSRGVFHYQARITYQQFAAQACRAAIDNLVKRYGAIAITQCRCSLDRVSAKKVSVLRRQIKRTST